MRKQNLLGAADARFKYVCQREKHENGIDNKSKLNYAIWTRKRPSNRYSSCDKMEKRLVSFEMSFVFSLSFKFLQQNCTGNDERGEYFISNKKPFQFLFLQKRFLRIYCLFHRKIYGLRLKIEPIIGILFQYSMFNRARIN